MSRGGGPDIVFLAYVLQAEFERLVKSLWSKAQFKRLSIDRESIDFIPHVQFHPHQIRSDGLIAGTVRQRDVGRWHINLAVHVCTTSGPLVVSEPCLPQASGRRICGLGRDGGEVRILKVLLDADLERKIGQIDCSS